MHWRYCSLALSYRLISCIWYQFGIKSCRSSFALWVQLTTRMSRRKRRHLKSPRSLTDSSASRSHSGCLLHQGILLTPSLSFHDNRASHSRDTIWPWKFTVKGQGQRYPSQCSVQLTHFLSVSHQGILSTAVPFVPWQSGLPFPRYNLTLKIQGQRWRSKVPQSAKHPVDSFPFCFTSIGPTIPKIWQI